MRSGIVILDPVFFFIPHPGYRGKKAPDAGSIPGTLQQIINFPCRWALESRQLPTSTPRIVDTESRRLPTSTPRIVETESRQLPTPTPRIVVSEEIRTSPWIRSKYSKGFNSCVSDLCRTDLYKNRSLCRVRLKWFNGDIRLGPSYSMYVSTPFINSIYGVRSSKFNWAPWAEL
jgi:hypothetical protein